MAEGAEQVRGAGRDPGTGQPRPVVLLVIDGLRRDFAERRLTTLFEFVEDGHGSYRPMTSLMPTNSRPSYATISAGVPSPENGIGNNPDARLVSVPSIWSVARDHGLVTAASAFHWWAECFNGVPSGPPFARARDTLVTNGEGGIQHGFFYMRDGETDPVVFAHALQLWESHRPDLLLIHPCSVDWAGDYWGAANLAYDVSVQALNLLLPPLLAALWHARPEAVVLATSDHGMSDIRGHGWDAPELRDVFFFALGDGMRVAYDGNATSLDIAPTILHLLDLPIPEGMTGNVLASATE